MKKPKYYVNDILPNKMKIVNVEVIDENIYYGLTLDNKNTTLNENEINKIMDEYYRNKNNI